ncbi:MAG: hypothetical protein KatS3mg042_1345 [Rhodothermaceae bacterium]|nr:MAG: hypothetical protein KatS3mg042_1345 [Rhodothermaceae bacterium]
MNTGCFHLAALLPDVLAQLAALAGGSFPESPPADRPAALPVRPPVTPEPDPCSTNALLLRVMHRAGSNT